ncbi:MAG TPA: PAS domain S-box protein [Bacteroidota bacterium]|nr:PAS domain S-box protein [Bacteroidota bacterium]
MPVTGTQEQGEQRRSLGASLKDSLGFVLDSTNDVIAVIDTSNTILYANKPLRLLIGEEAVGASMIRYLSSEDCDNFTALVSEVFEGRKPEARETFRVTATDHAIHIIEWKALPDVEDPDTDPTVVLIGRDITHQVHIENQMRLLGTSVESTKDAFCLNDLKDNFLYVNPAFCKMYGYTQDELVGKNISLVRPDTVPLEDANDIRTLTLQQGEWSGEIENRRRNGEIFPVELWTSVVRSDEGEPVGFVGVARDITQRKKTDQQLLDALQRMELVLDNLNIISFELDPEGKFLLSRGKGLEKLDLLPDQVVGMSIGDVYGEYPVIMDAFRRALHGESRTFEAEVQGVVWYSTLLPVMDLHGSVKRIFGIGVDVTERKRSETLQSALYRIAETTSTSVDLFELYKSIHSIIAELMYARNFYIAMFDEERNMVSFPYFVDEFDPQPSPRPPDRGLTAYVLRSGKSLLCDSKKSDELAAHGEAELVGSPSPIWLGVPLSVEGKIRGVMVVQHYSDAGVFTIREQHILEFVSAQVAKAIEHKRSEDALRESQAELVAVFNSMKDVIIVFDAEGRYLKIAETNEALLYRPARQLIGKTLHEVLPKEKADSLFAAIHSALERKSSVNLEYSLEIDKREYWFSGVISPMNESSVVLVARDVTEGRRLEEQLRQAQKMEGIGTLAGGIAHDFNNILGIILGYAGLLENRALDSRLAIQSVETIKRAVQRGADLVRQLLTFARKSEPAFTRVNVNEIVTELSKMLSQTLPKTITIATDLGESVPPIIADETQLHQALLNLSLNARDAMTDDLPDSPNTGTLTLASRVVSDEVVRKRFPDHDRVDEYVAVSVSDTGRGMDEATLNRVFEPFFTTKGLGKGTGLGLAVVYGITKSHGALIDVQSRKGEGTTFTLFFPVARYRDEDLGTTVGGFPRQPKGNETILVVEDEEMLALLLKSILEEQGYRVMTAKDGQEALSIYRKYFGEIAVVLSDMGLPRLGGWEMFQEMKRMNPKVKAILASGYFDPNLKIDLINAGAKDFIQKPYVAEVILSRIREVIDVQ